MTIAKIAAVEGAAVLVLPKELLEKLGIDIGDELDVRVEERILVAHPVEKASNEREQNFEEMVEELLTRRKWLYEKLAEGPP